MGSSWWLLVDSRREQLLHKSPKTTVVRGMITKLLFHVEHASLNCRTVVIQSSDTALAILCLTPHSDLNCKDLCVRAGVRDKLIFIPIHSLATELGGKFCEAPPALQALTGFGSNIPVKSVKRALTVLQKDASDLDILYHLGEEPHVIEAINIPATFLPLMLKQIKKWMKSSTGCFDRKKKKNILGHRTSYPRYIRKRAL